MKDRLASCFSIVLLAALVGGTWWAAEYTRSAVAPDPLKRMTHELDSYVTRFTIVRSDPHGMPVTRLEGGRLNHYPDDDSYEITTFRAVSQRPDRPAMTARADHARMDEDGARIVLSGDALLRRLPTRAGAAELSVRSEEITLLPDQDVAFTEHPATIVNGASTIEGRGVRYNNVTRELQIRQQTRVHLQQ